MNLPQREEQARSYWIEQMEAAAAFMSRVLDMPVRDCGEPMVFLPEAVRRAGVEVVFSDTLLAGRLERRFYLREGLAETFLKAARLMNARGWVLKIEDAYRCPEMQRSLGADPDIFSRILDKVFWERRGETPTVELMFRRLSVLIATRAKVGTHMSGSALDISVLRSADGEPLERGGPYLELSERTPMSSPFVPESARQNRERISAIMLECGFVAYPYEFWHYSRGDLFQTVLDPRKPAARYAPVHLDTASGAVSPIREPNEPLHTLEELKRAVREAVEKRNPDTR